MATTQVNAVGQYQACAYRVWKLAADCSIDNNAGAANAIVGTGVVRANMTVDVKAGTEIEATTACGSLAWQTRDVDRIKGWNLDLEIATWDYEALAYIVGGELITADAGDWAGDAVGWAAPGPTSNTQNAVAIEIWSRTAYSTGACSSVVGAPAYVRHIFPRCLLQLQDRAFEEATPAYMKFQGRVEANPQLLTNLIGAVNVAEAAVDTPWNGPAVISEDLANSTYIQMFAASDELPISDNDPNVLNGGYTAYTVGS